MGSYNKGKNNPMYGHTLSEDTKRKISESMKGNCMSTKSRNKSREKQIKRYARIIKDGKYKGTQYYALVCDGIRIQRSVDVDKLKQHPIYTRTIDLSRYKCADCIYATQNKWFEYEKCSVYGEFKYTPQSCVMFNFSQKFWRH